MSQVQNLYYRWTDVRFDSWMTVVLGRKTFIRRKIYKMRLTSFVILQKPTTRCFFGTFLSLANFSLIKRT